MQSDKEGCISCIIWIALIILGLMVMRHTYQWGTASNGIITYSGQLHSIEVTPSGYTAWIVTDNSCFSVHLTVAQRNAVTVGETVTIDLEHNKFGVQIGSVNIHPGTHPNPEKN